MKRAPSNPEIRRIMRNPKSKVGNPKEVRTAKTKALASRLIGFCILQSAFGLSCLAQGTAFTYQGRLDDGTNPAAGIYDLRFSIHDLPSGGSVVGGPVTNSATVVSNGLFTVTLDFGTGVFNGAGRWLEIGVRANGAALFTDLTPRQQITATPYAVTASNVTGIVPATQLSGILAAAQLSGTYTGAVAFENAANSFAGSGSGLASVNAVTLGGLTASQFWRTTGNSGTSPANFLGTTDNQPLELRVGGQRGLRLQPGHNQIPSILSGSLSNVISAGAAGAAIGGGNMNFIESFPFAESDFAVIGGGSSNTIGSFSFNAVIGGGFQNDLEPNTYFSTIAGGLQNRVGTLARHSSISGGRNNALDQLVDAATIGGGANNFIGGYSDFAAIGGGEKNFIGTNAQYSAISGGWENMIGAEVFYGNVGGGQRNRITGGRNGAIAGGAGNLIEGASGAISGGRLNGIRGADDSVIGGGFGNTIQTNANTSVIAGGGGNEIQNDASTSFIGGGSNNKVGTNASSSVIGGGGINNIQRDADHATIGGGQLNTIGPAAERSVIAGGDGNSVGAAAAAVGGGALNVIETNATQSVIAGGGGNRVKEGAPSATIGGGLLNIVGGGASTIAGGQRNSSINEGSTTSGGGQNTNTGFYATIPGGAFNVAAGEYSFAAGQRAKANHDGAFVWADSQDADFASTANNQFLIRASGGVGIGTADPKVLLHLRNTGPVMLLQDTASAANQAGYVGFWNNASVETGWVGFGTPGSPNFSVRNARSSGNILLLPGSGGRVGISRTPVVNALEVEGNASKTTSGSWLANSDGRIKTDIAAITNALATLGRVRLVSFRYTDAYRAAHPIIPDKHYLNVVAQEFREVFPGEVKSSGEKLPDGSDEILQVDTHPLTIYSAAAIQELNRKLEETRAENAELKQRLGALEKLVHEKTN
jgi:hypothetical protein